LLAAELTYQSVLVPVDSSGLVGVGVGEAFDLTTLTTEQAVKLRADLVAFTLANGMALSASGLEMISVVQSSNERRKRPAPFLASPVNI
jgi:hypothetical protein